MSNILLYLYIFLYAIKSFIYVRAPLSIHVRNTRDKDEIDNEDDTIRILTVSVE